MEALRNSKWAGFARWSAVAIVGTLVGSVLIGPATAHLNSPLTFAHLKKHFYTKKAANNRFINVGEQATSAANADKLDGKDSTEFLGSAGKAADADKLDNLDSTAFQRSGCVNGNVLGYAFIDDDATGAAFGDVPISFTCVSGFTVQAREDSPMEFTIDFGFNGSVLLSPCSTHIPLATPTEANSTIRAANTSEGGGIFSDNCVVKIFTGAATSFNVVIHRSA